MNLPQPNFQQQANPNPPYQNQQLQPQTPTQDSFKTPINFQKNLREATEKLNRNLYDPERESVESMFGTVRSQDNLQQQQQQKPAPFSIRKPDPGSDESPRQPPAYLAEMQQMKTPIDFLKKKARNIYQSTYGTPSSTDASFAKSAQPSSSSLVQQTIQQFDRQATEYQDGNISHTILSPSSVARAMNNKQQQHSGGPMTFLDEISMVSDSLRKKRKI